MMRLRDYIDRNQIHEDARNERDNILKRLDIRTPPLGFDVGFGWATIVGEALEKMIAAGWNKDLQQVKQKFCSLRVYIGDSSDEIDAIISDAEQRCSEVCEVCGNKREPNTSYMGMALCTDCGYEE